MIYSKEGGGDLYISSYSRESELGRFRKPIVNSSESAVCSGPMKPDTNIGGNIAAVSEVFNEKTTSIFLDRI